MFSAGEAKKQGLILDTKILLNTPRDPNDWDIAIATLYPSFGKAMDFNQADDDKRQAQDDAKKKRRDKDWGDAQAPLQQLKNAGPCPFVKTLYDASRYVEFKDDREASASVGFSGEIQGVSAGCQYKDDEPIRGSVDYSTRPAWTCARLPRVRGLPLHVQGRVEPVHLAGEFGVELFGGVRTFDLARRAASLDQPVPVLIEGLPERVHGPHPGDHDPHSPVLFHLPTSARILRTS